MIGGTFAATYPTASGVRSWRPPERQPSGAWQEFECGLIAKKRQKYQEAFARR
jgi:hypothetical protein